MPITLLQPYQFTIEFSVILLSSDGPKQVNCGIQSVYGIKFPKRDTDGSRGPPLPSRRWSVSHSVVALHANSLCACEIVWAARNTETCRNRCKALGFTNAQVCLSFRESSLVSLWAFSCLLNKTHSNHQGVMFSFSPFSRAYPHYFPRSSCNLQYTQHSSRVSAAAFNSKQVRHQNAGQRIHAC